MRPIATDGVAWSVWVCVSVCVSVCLSVCLLPVVVARSSSDIAGAIRHVLSFLWMTHEFSHNGAHGSKSSTTLCFIHFARWRYRGRYDCGLVYIPVFTSCWFTCDVEFVVWLLSVLLFIIRVFIYWLST